MKWYWIAKCPQSCTHTSLAEFCLLDTVEHCIYVKYYTYSISCTSIWLNRWRLMTRIKQVKKHDYVSPIFDIRRINAKGTTYHVADQHDNQRHFTGNSTTQITTHSHNVIPRSLLPGYYIFRSIFDLMIFDFYTSFSERAPGKLSVKVAGDTTLHHRHCR